MAETSEHSRQLVEGLYRSALSGDMAGVFELLADDVLVLEPSFLPYGGEVRGKAAFAGLLEEIAAHLDMAAMELESLIAEGDTVMAFLRTRTVKGGEAVVLAERSLVRDGKIVEMKIFYHEGGDLFPRAADNNQP